jgi:outer membrane receptor protein involved in Fe transport
MKIRNQMFRTVAAATLVTGLGSGFALAQETAQPASEDSVASNDEIVVTARKREENKQDIPIAVTAFSAAALEDRLIQNTTDLAAFTPGFAFNEGFGRDGDRPVIRGTANILITDGKVGAFVDGAPILGDSSGIDLEAFQRVEVIKGPQSAVFGRGTLSGAINYVSRRPGDEPSFKIEGVYGNWGRADLVLSADGPVPLPGVGDYLKAQLFYKTYNFDGDYNNALDAGRKLGGQNSKTINAALFFEPARELDMSLRYIKSEDRDNHFAVRLQPGSANNCFLTTRPTFCGTIQLPTQFAINTADILKPGLERDTTRYIFDSSLELFDGAVTASYQGTSYEQSEVSGYDQSYDARTFHLSAAFAACVVPLPNRRCGFSPFNDTNGFREFGSTHELRFETDAEAPVRARLGYFVLDRTRKNDFRWLELYSSGPDVAGSRSSTDTEAVFGGVEWDVTPDLKIGAELRAQTDKISDLALSYRVGDYFPVAPSGTLSFNPNAVVGNAANAPARTRTFKSTLPRLTVDYRMSDDVLLYGQYSVGNAPGGFNTVGAPQEAFDEEKLTNYEVGVKTQLFGFNYLNLTAYFMEYADQVLTTNFTSATAVQSYNTNLGTQEISGFEFEAQRELLPGFTVTGTLSYVDGEFTEGVDPQQALFTAGAFCSVGAPSATNPWGFGTTASILQTGTGVPLTTSTPPNPNGTTVTTSTVVTPNGGVPAGASCAQLGSIVGKKSPLVPPLQASLATRYEREWSNGMLFFVGADVTYRDSFYAQVDNLQRNDSATRVNAQIGLEQDGWKATLWGKNLTNETSPEGMLRYVDFLVAPPPGPTVTGGSVTAPAGGPGFQGTPRAFAVAAPRKPAFGITISKSW